MVINAQTAHDLISPFKDLFIEQLSRANVLPKSVSDIRTPDYYITYTEKCMSLLNKLNDLAETIGVTGTTSLLELLGESARTSSDNPIVKALTLTGKLRKNGSKVINIFFDGFSLLEGVLIHRAAQLRHLKANLIVSTPPYTKGAKTYHSLKEVVDHYVITERFTTWYHVLKNIRNLGEPSIIPSNVELLVRAGISDPKAIVQIVRKTVEDELIMGRLREFPGMKNEKVCILYLPDEAYHPEPIELVFYSKLLKYLLDTSLHPVLQGEYDAVTVTGDHGYAMEPYRAKVHISHGGKPPKLSEVAVPLITVER